MSLRSGYYDRSDQMKKDTSGSGQDSALVHSTTDDNQLLNTNLNGKCNSPPGDKSTSNGGQVSVRRRKDQAKYHTLPVSSSRDRARSGCGQLPSGKESSAATAVSTTNNGTRKSVIRSWLSKWGKKPVLVPVSVCDKSTQTDNSAQVPVHRAAVSVKCVNCVNSINYCCPSEASVMCNCPSCPPTLLVPSVVNGQSGTGHSVVHPCATVYYAEPVDPSCLQCIASCPPSLICPGGYKCSGLFTSSSCNNVSNSNGNSNSCQNNSALATAAAAATATTTTSTGVLQRDMYC